MRIHKPIIASALLTIGVAILALGEVAYVGVASAQTTTCKVDDLRDATKVAVFEQTAQHQIGDVVFYETKWTRDWATSQGMLNIDHHVSKMEAVELGLCDKSDEVQEQFAQDLLNLYATNPAFNQGKLDRNPAQIAAIKKDDSVVKTTLRDKEKATEYCKIRHKVLQKYELMKPETETECVNWLVYGQATAPTPTPTPTR